MKPHLMPSQKVAQHPFEALCNIASCERWCWKMRCSTCGHMLFRYALRQLALGVDPTKPTWVVHSDHPVLRRGAPLRQLGPVPSLGGWPIEEQRRLIAILRTADIQIIASKSAFPDWLGYIGLALHYSEDAEIEVHDLTRIWSPQLAHSVRPGSSASCLLAELANDPIRTPTWRHLETIESAALR